MMADEPKYNRIGEAIETFREIVQADLCGMNGEPDKDLPHWLFQCLLLITTGSPSALESLLQNLDEEEPLPWWINLEILRLVNTLCNEEGAEMVLKQIESPINVTIDMSRSQSKKLPGRPVDPETESKVVNLKTNGESNIKIAESTGIHRNTVGNILRRHPDVEQKVTESPSKQPTDEGTTYLGEIRRAIGIADEPFTKDDIREIVLQTNPQWDAKTLTPNLHNGFSYLYRTGCIDDDPGHDATQPGPSKFIRTEKFCPDSKKGRNARPVIEPATGKRWKSVQAFLHDENILDNQHRIYRAIADGKPLDDGRVIQYADEVKDRELLSAIPKVGVVEATHRLVCRSCGAGGDDPGFKCEKCGARSWERVYEKLAVPA